MRYFVMDVLEDDELGTVLFEGTLAECERYIENERYRGVPMEIVGD